TIDQTLSSATARAGQTFTASVVSQRIGDSEFPANSKLEGVVAEARPKTKDNPGLLDLNFTNVVFPDGRRQPIQAELVSLDDKNLKTTSQGRIMAPSSGRS